MTVSLLFTCFASNFSASLCVPVSVYIFLTFNSKLDSNFYLSSVVSNRQERGVCMLIKRIRSFAREGRCTHECSLEGDRLHAHVSRSVMIRNYC
jgi:hypothetical protein